MSLFGKLDLKALSGTTISVTQNNATVTGSGTAFDTELKEGSVIVIASVKYKILSIASATSLTLAIPYQGSTNASLAIAGGAVTTGSFVIGNTYKISTVGDTDFTLIGASANTVGVVFTATGVGAGTTGQATSFNVYGQQAPTSLNVASSVVTAGSFVPQKTYKISIPGNTDFTLIGAANSTAGTVFTATGVGVGSGTAIPYKPSLDLSKIVFVSREEAQLDSNKKKGIHGGGWWRINSYIDSAGDTRYKTELLAAVDATFAQSNDAADDLLAADTNPVITIGTQPAAQTTVSGAATFSVSATVSVVSPAATITYQWQKAVAGSTRFANVSGATSSSLVLSGQTSGNTGDRYRVVINTTPNAIAAVTSNAATLTFGT